MVIAVLLLFSLLNFLQSMAAGPFGQSGHLVTCHVGEVCRRDHGPAPTQRRWMVELSARACLCRRYHATPRVQVSCVHTHTHNAAQHCRKTLSNCPYIVSGVSNAWQRLWQNFVLFRGNYCKQTSQQICENCLNALTCTSAFSYWT